MSEDSLDIAARRMLARFGGLAAEITAGRAEEMARHGDWRGQDMALLMLNRIETLAAPQRPAAR